MNNAQKTGEQIVLKDECIKIDLQREIYVV